METHCHTADEYVCYIRAFLCLIVVVAAVVALWYVESFVVSTFLMIGVSYTYMHVSCT